MAAGWLPTLSDRRAAAAGSAEAELECCPPAGLYEHTHWPSIKADFRGRERRTWVRTDQKGFRNHAVAARRRPAHRVRTRPNSRPTTRRIPKDNSIGNLAVRQEKAAVASDDYRWICARSKEIPIDDCIGAHQRRTKPEMVIQIGIGAARPFDQNLEASGNPRRGRQNPIVGLLPGAYK